MTNGNGVTVIKAGRSDDTGLCDLLWCVSAEVTDPKYLTRQRILYNRRDASCCTQFRKHSADSERKVILLPAECIPN
jgi:hypothetical protein